MDDTCYGYREVAELSHADDTMAARLIGSPKMDKQAITLRRYVAGDAAALTRLFRASVRGIAARDYSQAQILAWAPDHIDARLFGQKCESRATWVAEVEGRIAGFSDLEPDGHVDMLYVDPEFQGRGVARALLHHIETLAGAAGVRRLYAEASITAQPVFAALGFRTVAAQTVTIRGAALRNYRMEKPLAAPADLPQAR